MTTTTMTTARPTTHSLHNRNIYIYIIHLSDTYLYRTETDEPVNQYNQYEVVDSELLQTKIIVKFRWGHSRYLHQIHVW